MEDEETYVYGFEGFMLFVNVSNLMLLVLCLCYFCL